MSDRQADVPGLLGLAHVGVATADLEPSVAFFGLLGLELDRVEDLPGPGLRAAIGTLGGQTMELLAPTRKETPLTRFLERRGPGIHHLAYYVADIDACIQWLVEAGLEPLSIGPEPGIGGARTIFFHPRSAHGILLELVETGSPGPELG